MDTSHSGSDSQSLQSGIRQFNQGEYYACHDTLEAIWMVAPTAEKPFFQGILQFAVALYHLGNLNWRGAAILLGEGMRRLEPFEPSYANVNVTALLDCADDWLVAIQQLGPEHIELLAEALQLTHQGQAGPDKTAHLPPWKIQVASS